MQLEHLLGNERFKKALAPFFKENFPQSVILEGPPGTGKKTAAYDIARNLMCTGPQPPCGRCGACVRMAAGSHPDYQVFNQEGGNIRVDDIRQVRKLSFIRPSEARQKVFVINGAGNMNPQAQNALLKVLEEPQETVFLLLCEQAGQLLQTFRSRCVRFAVEELSEEQIRQELQRRMPEADPAAVQAAAQRSGGSLGRGLCRLENGPDKGEELASRFLAALSHGELAVLEACLEVAKLSRAEYTQFCNESCLQLCELAKQDPAAEWAMPLYGYLRELSARAEGNASVSAMSGALSAFCGQLLFARG